MTTAGVLLELVTSLTPYAAEEEDGDANDNDDSEADYANAWLALYVFYISVVFLFVFGTIKVRLLFLQLKLSAGERAAVVSGAAAKQRPVGGQAEPGHTQQGACAPADPSAPRGEHRVWGVGGLGVGAPAMCPRPPTHISISCRPPRSGPRAVYTVQLDSRTRVPHLPSEGGRTGFNLAPDCGDLAAVWSASDRAQQSPLNEPSRDVPGCQ